MEENNDMETSKKRKTAQEQLAENPRKIHQPSFFHSQEINNNPTLQGFINGFNGNDDHSIDLNLSLSLSLSQSSNLNDNDNSTTPLLSPIPQIDATTVASSSSTRRGQRHSLAASTSRSRSNGGRTRAVVKTDCIEPSQPWATDKRATVHSMEYLMSHGIKTITGDVECKKCEKSFMMEYDLEGKFRELVSFMLNEDMKHRAPKAWNKPILPTCKYCGEVNSCKPKIGDKKRRINWLFLLLGQLLGCCTLEQLKYFCKHTQNHRTGAKDRVLFLSYYTLCKQLDPNSPFDL